MRKIIAYSLGGLMVLIFALALVSELTPKSRTPSGKIGDTVTVGDWSYRVIGTERQKTVPSSFFLRTDAKGEWLIVYVSIKNIGKQPAKLEWSSFTVYDVDNAQFPADKNGSGSFSATKKIGNMTDLWPPGVGFDTAVVFDVDPEATGLKLGTAKGLRYITLE